MHGNDASSGNGAGDSVLAGGLIASPAWVPSLSSVNELLTTVTLILGVALARLWLLIKRRRARGAPPPRDKREGR